MGRVVLAYRLHPHHNPPITQDIVAGWFDISAAQLGRYETGNPITDLTRLIRWAKILRIPEHLLWFKLPSARGTAADTDREERGYRRPAPEPGTRHPTTHPPAASHRQQPASAHGQSRHDQVLVLPDQLAALLEAGELSASGLLELLTGAGGHLPVTGLLPTGATSPSVPSSPPGLLAGLSTGRNLTFGDGRYEVIARFGEVLLVAFDRRLFLVRVGASGVALPLATEVDRQGLARDLLGDSWKSAEAWQAIVREHYATYVATPPAEMFVRLSSDIDALRDAFRHERSESGRSELQKAGALLISLLSSTFANLGDLPTCIRWMQIARQTADASGDFHTRIGVRGREVVLGLYQKRPLGELLNIAEEGIALGEAGNAADFS